MRSGRVVALSAVQPAARAATAVDILGAIGVAELAAGIAKAAPLVVFNGKVSGSLRFAGGLPQRGPPGSRNAAVH